MLPEGGRDGIERNYNFLENGLNLNMCNSSKKGYWYSTDMKF